MLNIIEQTLITARQEQLIQEAEAERLRKEVREQQPGLLKHLKTFVITTSSRHNEGAKNRRRQRTALKQA
ncbi:MAG: hypothetical protein AAF485_05220 [Chloroflexota bacterium]